MEVTLVIMKLKKKSRFAMFNKTLLNSILESVCQRSDVQQCKTKFLHESEADFFFQMLFDRTIVPGNFHVVSRDVFCLEWSNNSLFTSFDNEPIYSKILLPLRGLGLKRTAFSTNNKRMGCTSIQTLIY